MASASGTFHDERPFARRASRSPARRSRADSARAAVSGSLSPEIVCASSRLGTRIGPSANSSAGNGRAGAGLMTTRIPLAAASRAAASTARREPRSWPAERRPSVLVVVKGRFDQRCIDFGIGARRDGDLVLARLVDHDQRDACRRVVHAARLGRRRCLHRRGRRATQRLFRPRQPRRRTSPPRRARAAATAWFAPLPPKWRAKVPPMTVSPGAGRRGTRTTRSTLIEPTTTTRPRPRSGACQPSSGLTVGSRASTCVPSTGRRQRGTKGRSRPG